MSKNVKKNLRILCAYVPALFLPENQNFFFYGLLYSPLPLLDYGPPLSLS